jgi:hypothetical protein
LELEEGLALAVWFCALEEKEMRRKKTKYRQ